MTRSHINCSDWGYDAHPNRYLVTQRCQSLSNKVQHHTQKYSKYGYDTRLAHKFMFWNLTPAECRCIAGSYRGDKNCASLVECNVRVGTDTRVGIPSYSVFQEMHNLEQRCIELIKIHNIWKATKGSKQSAANCLLKFVSILADILQAFLTIHPYMDGNGHTGRLLIYVMMVREGYIPKNWDIDAKQPYADALSRHRDGKPGALQEFLLKTIVG